MEEDGFRGVRTRCGPGKRIHEIQVEESTMNTKKNTSETKFDLYTFWKITIALLLLAGGYATSLLLLMKYIGTSM
jgi:hypothetical protein